MQSVKELGKADSVSVSEIENVLILKKLKNYLMKSI